MTQKESIRLFEERKVRAIWDDEQEEWYFSIVDVISILTDSPNPRKYWSVLKTRLKREGSELTTNCSQLKMQAADGKKYLTDVANTEQLFRLIQSVPSPKAEPFKLWIAQVAKERLDQMQDPELSIEQAMADYKRLGYSDNWINQRLKSIEIRKDLTDEWKKRGLEEGLHFATLTDIIYKSWSDMTSKEYKRFKGLRKENLRDNMTNKELVLNMLADYKRLGYSDNWINQRLKSIEIRKDLTDEWKKRGLEEGLHFATLTDIIYKSWSDMTSKEYKRFKGLRKENLRDNMTNKELVLNMLAELSTKEISEASEPDTFSEHINVAQQGGEVARNARLELEAKTGKSVISPLNAQKIISLKKGENERDV